MERLDWVKSLDIPKERIIEELDKIIGEMELTFQLSSRGKVRREWAKVQFRELSRERNLLAREVQIGQDL